MSCKSDDLALFEHPQKQKNLLQFDFSMSGAAGEITSASIPIEVYHRPANRTKFYRVKYIK